MDVELDAGSFKDFQTRYETLRQNHLDGVGGWAMSIFLREGMCGWILGRTQDPSSHWLCLR